MSAQLQIVPSAGNAPAAGMETVPRSPRWSSPFQTGIKRAADVLFGSILLVLCMPLMVLIALAIKLDSAGSVLYPWRVVGQDGRPFLSWKFRSMCADADRRKARLLAENEMRGPVFKIENDPRITRVGRFLRRYSLDELPQLASVVVGDMSLVGPRPPLAVEYAKFSPAQRRKLAVKPGITCLWQVSGRNQIRDFDEWVRLDLEYLRAWSLWLDCKILWRTVYAVFGGTGR